jgi:hypothetical protein
MYGTGAFAKFVLDMMRTKGRDYELHPEELIDLYETYETMMTFPTEYRSDSIHLTLADCLVAGRQRGRIADAQSFKYVSSEKTPMFGDMVYWREDLPVDLLHRPPTRVYLGSESEIESAPLSVEEQKESAYRLFDERPDLTPAQVAKLIRASNPRQVSCWKAWHTMRKQQ